MVRRSQLLLILIIIITFIAFFLTITHFREMSRQAVLAETFKNMNTLKDDIDMIETANWEVKQQIETLRNNVVKIQRTLKKANSSVEET